MKLIPLTRGKVTIVDDADYPHVAQFKWHAVKTTKRGPWYAVRYKYLGGGKAHKRQRRILLHRFLISGVEVDHKNGDGLDNRRDNLRPATRQQNLWNTCRHHDNRTGFKGVSLTPSGDCWRARIMKNRINYFLGRFDSARAAAEAYDRAAKRLFGDFAKLNF